jgi:hypothetical protein
MDGNNFVTKEERNIEKPKLYLNAQKQNFACNLNLPETLSNFKNITCVFCM